MSDVEWKVGDVALLTTSVTRLECVVEEIVVDQLWGYWRKVGSKWRSSKQFASAFGGAVKHHPDPKSVIADRVAYLMRQASGQAVDEDTTWLSQTKTS